MTDRIDVVDPDLEVDVIQVGVSGPPGTNLTAAEKTDITNRLTVVEGVAQTINPFPTNGAEYYVSTQSHGVGGQATSSFTIAPNYGFSTPIWLPAATSMSTIGPIEVVTPVAGSSVKIVIYRANGQRLWVSAPLGTASAGLVYAAISGLVMPAGMSWVCVIPSHANLAIRALVNGRPLGHEATLWVTFLACTGEMSYAAPPATLVRTSYWNVAPFVAMRPA